MIRQILCTILCTMSVCKAVGQDTASFISKDHLAPQKRTVHIAIRTNLLYDIIATPNISAEIPLRRNWSVGAGYWHTWWSTDPLHKYWRTYGGEIYARKYLGHTAEARFLSGHHIGVVSQIGTYDFEFGGTGYMSDFSYSAGMEYGYSLPVGKNVNIDFSATFGYIGGKYKVYKPIDTHYVWQYDRYRKWIGPTKAEISLVFMLHKKAQHEHIKQNGGNT